MNTVRVMLLTVLAFILPGCGGKSSVGKGPDTMTVTISGRSGTTTTTYTEKPHYVKGRQDPELLSYIRPFSGTTIQLHGSNEQGSTTVLIIVQDSIVQTYSTGFGTSNVITYVFSDTHYQSCISMFSNTNGTITLSSIGNVGERITGTFDATVDCFSSEGGSETLNISGSFSVTRDN